MNSKNMNYAFSVEYLEAALNEAVDNNELISIINNNKGSIVEREHNHVQEICNAGASVAYLEIQYPGMLMGTGYPHETGKAEGEIQVGFSFDYVTGAPTYPGSSLKGVIKKANELTGKGLNIDKDIFYGAYVVGLKNPNGNIVGIDNLAPHGDDITKAPNIITMLRLMPGVIVAVVIKTSPSQMNEYVKLLELMGMGAKTNVGYGQVVNKENFTYGTIENVSAQPSQNARSEHNNRSANSDNSSPVIDTEVEAVIERIDEKDKFFSFRLKRDGKIPNKASFIIYKDKYIEGLLHENDKVIVKFKEQKNGFNNYYYVRKA